MCLYGNLDACLVLVVLDEQITVEQNLKQGLKIFDCILVTLAWESGSRRVTISNNLKQSQAGPHKRVVVDGSGAGAAGNNFCRATVIWLKRAGWDWIDPTRHWKLSHLNEGADICCNLDGNVSDTCGFWCDSHREGVTEFLKVCAINKCFSCMIHIFWQGFRYFAGAKVKVCPFVLLLAQNGWRYMLSRNVSAVG